MVQFLPPEKRDLNYDGADTDLEIMLFNARGANRIYAASIGIWVGLPVIVLFFLGLSLASTWAADAPARSGRRLLARLFCYAELYLPAGMLVVAGLGFLVLWLTVEASYHTSEPSWSLLLGLLAVLAGLVATAHVGVARRWHPLARLGLYAALGRTVRRAAGVRRAAVTSSLDRAAKEKKPPAIAS